MATKGGMELTGDIPLEGGPGRGHAPTHRDHSTLSQGWLEGAAPGGFVPAVG